MRNASGPRLLLRNLRELMAEQLQPQARLNAIVTEIAKNMVAEVCSVYVLRADAMLELYATQGLNPDAVHSSQLRLGQGLVGTIAASAESLNLPEAQSHPAFTYLPETGEEIYHSFVGVPVLRSGRTLGVLVVQNKTQRHYQDVEVEVLETVAMLLAEIIASGELAHLSQTGLELDLGKPMRVEGVALSDGIGLGHIVLHDPRVVVTNLFSDDSQAEIVRLREAIDSLRLSIDDMLSRREIDFDGEHRAVLEAYRLFAHDQGWARRIEEAVNNGLTAEAAVEKVQSDMRARIIHQPDPFLRERISDFDDLANRLLRQLMTASTNGGKELPQDAIIVARSMGAAELLDYPRECIRGLVLEDGAATSHGVIVARAMGVPIVGQAKGVVSVSEADDAIIIDGDEGAVHLRPSEDLEEAYVEKVRFNASKQALFRELRDQPPVSKDGVPVQLLINSGLLIDMPQLEGSGADGIGLFRTELQFMVASTFPRAETQERHYRAVLDAANGKPVTFRLLDVGGDKILPYLDSEIQEENPAMGLRAIRITLSRPGLMRMQIRALLKAAAGRQLRLMLPMVSELDEINKVKNIIEAEQTRLRELGYQLPGQLEIGVMFEVPSLLFQLDEIMGAVDFVSIGSNDLFQFFMAVDRSNATLSARYDVLCPPFLRALKLIVQTAEKHNKSVTLCGEMARRPVDALALLGLGLRSLSMSPVAVGPVKAMLLGLELKSFQDEFDAVLALPADRVNIRQWLTDYANQVELTI